MFSTEQVFTISGDKREYLGRVLEFALELSKEKIKAFYIDQKGLVLCSYYASNMTKYPFEATVSVLVEHICQYLKSLPCEKIFELAGPEPDNDGDVILGWEVFHPVWYGENRIEKYDNSAVLAVRPCWIVYGK